MCVFVFVEAKEEDENEKVCFIRSCIWIVSRMKAREFQFGVPKYGYDRQNNNVTMQCAMWIVHPNDIESDIQNAINYMNNGFVPQQNDKLFGWKQKKKKHKKLVKLHCASFFLPSS